MSVKLIRETNNRYDNNAVGVHVSVNGSNLYQIGYLPQDIAELISRLIDNGIKLTAAFRGVTGGTAEAFNYGALIQLTI